MSELREGLARILACCEWDNVGEREISVMRPVADAALAYLRQHDGHAEFVRAVREIAERAVIRHGSGLGESLGTLNIITALCDAELAKEMSK